jgi:5-formyltetrahydrofolate cyclo-ligase
MSTHSLLLEQKARLRREAMARRSQAAAAAPEAGHAVAARIFSRIALPEGAPCSVWWPMGDELDTRPLLARLHFAGHPVGLPVVAKKAHPLVFRQWRPRDKLVPGGFGTSIPAPDRPMVEPRVLFCPLLAFDRAGYRVGYGGGFYDRTLVALRATGPRLAIGLAFAAQEVESVPRDEHGQRLDWIVTEKEAIELRLPDPLPRP